MATNINEEVSNAFNAAKQALNDDLKQNFYNAAQARMTAFRQINNNANAQHALYSGMPAAQQMQYDASKYVPGLGTALVSSLEKQEQNQQTWDKYMSYVNGLNAQASQYKKLAAQANAAAGQYGKATAGFNNIPSGGNINSDYSSTPTKNWPSSSASSSSTSSSSAIGDSLTQFSLNN